MKTIVNNDPVAPFSVDMTKDIKKLKPKPMKKLRKPLFNFLA
jgi:hypothetical protein